MFEVRVHISATARSEYISVQLRSRNVNYGLLWVGGPAEETSVDIECQSKIIMGGWISGRDICGHSSCRPNLSKFALDFQHVFAITKQNCAKPGINSEKKKYFVAVII